MAITADYMRHSAVHDWGRNTSNPASADVPGGLIAGDALAALGLGVAGLLVLL